MTKKNNNISMKSKIDTANGNNSSNEFLEHWMQCLSLIDMSNHFKIHQFNKMFVFFRNSELVAWSYRIRRKKHLIFHFDEKPYHFQGDFWHFEWIEGQSARMLVFCPDFPEFCPSFIRFLIKSPGAGSVACAAWRILRMKIMHEHMTSVAIMKVIKICCSMENMTVFK